MIFIRRVLIIGGSALVLSLLFFGVQLPVSEFTGCYIDRGNQDKLCINPDKTVVQFALNNGEWKEYNRSTWTAVAMDGIIQDSIIVKFASAVENNSLKENVVVQPYKGLLGKVRISFGNDVAKAEGGVIYDRLD